MVAYDIEDQDTAVGRLTADSPLFEEIDGITLDIGAVERIDRDQRDLRVRFFIDLTAGIANLRNGVRIEDVREIVDVAGGLELRDGFGPRSDRQQKDGDPGETKSCERSHRRNCTGIGGQRL